MNKARLGALALVLGFAIAFFALGLHHELAFDRLIARGGALVAYRTRHPAGTAAAYFIAYVAVTALSLPGAAAMTLAGGAVFGFLPALLLVSFASSIGATLAFMLARFIAHDWVQRRFANRLSGVRAGVERDGAFYLFAIRLVPVFPFWLVNLAMALTPLPPRTFYWVSQLGMLPGTAVFVYAGTQLGAWRLSPGLLLAFALLGVFPIVARRALDGLKARRIGRRWATAKPDRADQSG